MSYATEAVFRAAVGVEDVADEAAIQRALDSATEWIDEWCGRTFGALTASARYFVATDPWCLATPDVATVTELAVDTLNTLTFTTVLGPTTYQLYPLNVGQPGVVGTYQEIRIRSNAPQGFAPGYQVRVTGTWGYGSVPASVEMACILVANRYFRRPAAPFGVISAPETGEIARLPSKDPDVLALLKGFVASGQWDWVAV